MVPKCQKFTDITTALPMLFVENIKKPALREKGGFLFR